jgi:hypothetical protein
MRVGTINKTLLKLWWNHNGSNLAYRIQANVWKNGGDMRDVISIGKLVRKSDDPQEIGLIIKTMMKYGVDGE